MALCPHCFRRFRTPPDEEQGHACPSCHYHPDSHAVMAPDYATELRDYADLLDGMSGSPAGMADVCRDAATELERLEDQRAYWERRCEHWRSRVDHLRQGRV